MPVLKWRGAAAAPAVCNAAVAAFSICRRIGATEICFVEVLKRLEGLNGVYWND